MPLRQIEDFIAECRKTTPDLKAAEAILLIASKFEVSKQAVFHRLKNVSLIKQDYTYPF